MNTDMKACPKSRPILLLMPLIEKSEWVSAVWSPVFDCWLSTWGHISLFNPVAWDELPEIPEEWMGEKALVHRPVVTEETRANKGELAA